MILGVGGNFISTLRYIVTRLSYLCRHPDPIHIGILLLPFVLCLRIRRMSVLLNKWGRYHDLLQPQLLTVVIPFNGSNMRDTITHAVPRT